MNERSVPPEVEQEPVVRFIDGPLQGKTISLQKPVTDIGRDEQNDIVIVDPRVSRHHARIAWFHNSWIIESLSRTSFIAINQRRVQREKLQHNCTVNLGESCSFVFLLQSPILVPQPGEASPQDLVHYPLSPERAARLPVNIPEGSAHATLFAPSIPSLIISSNIRSGQQIYALKKNMQVFHIGRDPSSDIVISEPVVSALHAQIIREGSKLVFVHPHPTRGKTVNGIWYQGRHIYGNEPFFKQMVSGDIFRIGDEHGTLVTLRYEDGTTVSSEALPALEPVPLRQARLTIGRVSDNTLVLDHPQVSAHHAELLKVEEGYRIIDLNSTNHVYVNEDPVTNQVLRTGDDVRIGPYRLTYTGTDLRPYDESSHIRIDALALTKKGNRNVVLLNDISLVIPPRSFVAIVGGSGAGKSTLMNALSGLNPAQGTVLYNGVDYYRNLVIFSTQLGYVPQDDIVHRDLTVERALYYAARLRLPDDFTREQIQWRIDDVLNDVEIADRSTMLVSKLSGGQRKRVSIALELLAHPGIFFLDEPTSGLDPGLDRKMMSLLRKLADKGHTIILVTHATNNINACDAVCFLAQGGRLVYFGPPDEAKVFYEKTDFAEIYSALEPTKDHPEIPQEAEERFRGSTDYQQHVVRPLQEGPVQRRSVERAGKAQAPKRVRHGNAWSQFLLLSTRYLELLKNDVGNLLLLLLQAPIVAIILALVIHFTLGTGVFDADKLVQCATQVQTSPTRFLVVPQAKKTEKIGCEHVLTFLKSDPQGQAYAQKQGGAKQALQNFILPGPDAGLNAHKVLFIMTFGAVLFGCINSAREIVKESAIYRRERMVNLGILPYMFSKIVVLGLLCCVQSALLVLIVGLAEPLHQGIFLHPVLEAYITLTLTSLVGLMLGLTVSAIVPNNDRAISFVPIVLVPQVIFSGAIIPFKDLPIQILTVIFPTRWAMAALCSSVGLHSDKIEGDRLFGDDFTYHGTLFSIYSQTDALHRLLLSWAALGAILGVLMVVIVIFLKLKDVRR
jgi:ABC-type multidrug transport system ATPase subunit/pSer/pThr/pTyr-binding forkhead associated (FHA) protein